MKAIFSRVHLKASQVAALLILVFMSAICQMLLPSFLADMINDGVAAKANGVIITFGIIMASVTVMSAVINFLSVKIASRIATKFASDLRAEVFNNPARKCPDWLCSQSRT